MVPIKKNGINCATDSWNHGFLCSRTRTECNIPINVPSRVNHLTVSHIVSYRASVHSALAFSAMCSKVYCNWRTRKRKYYIMQSNGSDYGILSPKKSVIHVFGTQVHFGKLYNNWFGRYKRYLSADIRKLRCVVLYIWLRSLIMWQI
jgi:hypothetical protein